MAGSFVCIQFVASLAGDINQIMPLFLGVWILRSQFYQMLTGINL